MSLLRELLEFESEESDLEQGFASRMLAAADVLKPYFGPFHTRQQATCANRSLPSCHGHWHVQAIVTLARQTELTRVCLLLLT